MTRDEKIEKQLDDELISGQTVYERVNALPVSLQSHLMPNGQFPKKTMMIRVVVPDASNAGESYTFESMEIDPIYTIIDKNELIIKSPWEGWTRINMVMKDDMLKVRNVSIQYYKDINGLIGTFDKKSSTNKRDKDVVPSTSGQPKPIDSRHYSVSKYNSAAKSLKFKNKSFQVPNNILDEIVNYVAKNKHISTNQLEKHIIYMKKQQNYNQNRSIATFSDPLNTTAFGLPAESQSMLAKSLYPNKTINVSNMDVTMRSVNNEPLSQSTPRMKSVKKATKRRAPTKRKLIPTESILKYAPVVKNAQTDDQHGKGMKKKWQRI